MYNVFFKNSQIGQSSDKLVATFDTKEEAMAFRGSRNKMLSPGEKTYYGMKYYLRSA